MKHAIDRVEVRVSMGGHNIPADVIIRRYQSGLKNFVSLYQSIMDYWVFIVNSQKEFALIAEGGMDSELIIHNSEIWKKIQKSVLPTKK